MKAMPQCELLELSLGLQLKLEGLGHLRWRRAGHAEVDLDRVIDEPLKRG